MPKKKVIVAKNAKNNKNDDNDNTYNELAKLAGKRKKLPRIKTYEPERWVDPKPIGAGSFGKVYWAQDRDQNYLPVVIKQTTKSKNTRKEVLVEALAYRLLSDVCSSRRADDLDQRHLETISDTGIVPCLIDVFDDSKHYYLILEFVGDARRGTQRSWTTLGRWLGRVALRRLPSKDVERLVWNLVAAVKSLHSHGVVSRDLKPDNIMVNKRTLQVQIIDLGLACFVDGEVGLEQDHSTTPLSAATNDDEPLRKATKTEIKAGNQYGVCTITCLNQGTEEYMAPEVVLPKAITQGNCWYGRAAAEKTDIWALGMIVLALYNKDETSLVDKMIATYNDEIKVQERKDKKSQEKQEDRSKKNKKKKKIEIETYEELITSDGPLPLRSMKWLTKKRADWLLASMLEKDPKSRSLPNQPLIKLPIMRLQRHDADQNDDDDDNDPSDDEYNERDTSDTDDDTDTDNTDNDHDDEFGDGLDSDDKSMDKYEYGNDWENKGKTTSNIPIAKTHNKLKPKAYKPKEAKPKPKGKPKRNQKTQKKIKANGVVKYPYKERPINRSLYY